MNYPPQVIRYLIVQAVIILYALFFIYLPLKKAFEEEKAKMLNKKS